LTLSDKDPDHPDSACSARSSS
jgi:hypothetical protein